MKKLRAVILRLLTTRVAWPILLTISLLCAASLIALRPFPDRADRQQLFLIAGALILLSALLPGFQSIGRIAYAFYGAILLLLLAVLFAPQIKYTHRWFSLPGNLLLQPSEFAKIAFVLALAWLLRHRKNVREIEGLVLPFLLALIPFGLILIEPDLGTALLFPLILYAMLIAAGARLRHLVIIAIILPIAAWGYFPFLKDYQKARFYSFGRHVLNLESSNSIDPQQRDADLQQNLSRAAVGSGSSTGGGEEAQRFIKQNLLPESSTDFIFAIIAIQWGFAGSLLVLVFYLAFFAATVEIAASTKDNFGRLLVIGLASMILFQSLINIAMAIHLGPVVGIALPFLSYGGSSLLTNFLAAGLILNVSLRRNTHTSASR